MSESNTSSSPPSPTNNNLVETTIQSSHNPSGTGIKINDSAIYLFIGFIIIIMISVLYATFVPPIAYMKFNKTDKSKLDYELSSRAVYYRTREKYPNKRNGNAFLVIMLSIFLLYIIPLIGPKRYNDNEGLIIGIAIIAMILYCILVFVVHNYATSKIQYTRTETVDESGKVIKTEYYP